MELRCPTEQVSDLEASLGVEQAGRAADLAAARRLHEDLRERLSVAVRRVQSTVSPPPLC